MKNDESSIQKTISKRITPSRVALLYAVFTSVWMFSFSKLRTFTIYDVVFQGYIELAEGLIFVAVTSGLLYLLLKRWRGKEVSATTLPDAEMRPGRIMLLFTVLLLIVPLIGATIVKLYGSQIEHEAYANLDAISKLKAEQIENWLYERQGDCKMLMTSESLIRHIDQFTKKQTTTSREFIEKKFEILRSSYGYSSILLFNPNGQLLFASGTDLDIPVDFQQLLRQSLITKQGQRGDFYRDEQGNVHLDWVIPILLTDAQGEHIIASVVLRTTAQRFFPLIQTWPTASPSAETLLVRRDGESVLYLNTLRHRTDTALLLRLPLNQPELIAAIAIRSGKPGNFKGLDYRHVEVLGAYRPIKGTNWHIIAKIDRDEILAPLHQLVLWVCLIALIAIIAICIMLLVLWRQQQAQNLLLLAEKLKLSIADNSLRQNIESTQALMKSALDAVVSMDQHGKIIAWNPQAEVIFGYSPEQAIGRDVAELIAPPANRHGIARFLKTTTKTILGKQIETQGMRADGSEFPIELTVLELTQNHEQFFTAYIRDISERKQMEKKLRDSNAFNISVLNSLTSHIAVLDKQGVIVAVNKAWRQFCIENDLPESSQFLLGVSYLDTYKNAVNQPYSDEENTALLGINAVLAGEQEMFHLEYPCHSPSQQRWFSMNVSPLQGSRGGCVISHENITERKQAEQEIRSSKAKLEAALSSMSDAVYISDAEGRFIEFNEAFATFHKFRNKEESPKMLSEYPNFTDVYSTNGEFLPLEQRPVPCALRGETGRGVELTLRRRDTNEIWIGSYNYAPIRNNDGVIIGAVVTARDITERKQQEAMLVASEARYHSLFDNMQEGFAYCRMIYEQGIAKDFVYLEVNPAFEELTGLKDVIGKKVSAVIPGIRESDPAIFEFYGRVVLTGNPERIEFYVKSLGVWFFISAYSPMLGCFVAIFDVITERKTMEEALIASEKEFRLLAEAMPQIVWIASADGLNIYHNQQWVDYTGLSLEEGYGLGWCKSFHPDDKQRARDAWQYAVNNNAEYSLECQLRRADGIYRWWLVRGIPIYDEHGKVCKWFGTCTDIHEIKETERILREEERLLADSQAIAHIGSWMIDISTGTIIWSEETFQLYGLSPLTDKPPKADQFFELLHPDDRQRMKDWLDAISSGKQPSELEFRTCPVNGSSRYLLRNGVLETDSNGKPLRIIGTVQDITERKKAEETIYDLGYYDPLTHLPNRQLMLDRLKQALISRKLKNRYGAILFIDLNNFKMLNDTKGHDIGDLLLIEVSRHLKTAVHEDDTVARTGGDEFVVLIDTLDKAIDLAATQAESVGQRILNSISQPFNLQGYEYRCSASIGIALFHSHEISVEELLKQADIAMNQAKQFGHNTIHFFDPEIQIALEFRVQLESWMRKALQNEYKLYFQIQVDDENNATGAEVLIRWIHPEMGMISPADFISLAEETGLIIPIGQWVLETACTQLKAWEHNQKTRHLKLAVNVSAKQFSQPDFVKQVLAILDQTGANPDRLKLELTESMLAHNVEDIITKMKALREKGVRFSLDDFGTGFSSLSYLKRLPFNQLKIDQSFVRDALIDPNNAAIIRTIIDLGQSLGMDIIAEGVETEEQRNFLVTHGCKHYQGYLFSKPLPLDEFEQLLCNNLGST